MKRPSQTFCFTWNLFFLVNFLSCERPAFHSAHHWYSTQHTRRHNQSSGSHFFFLPLGFARKQRVPFWFAARLLPFAPTKPLLLSGLDRICRRIIDSFTPRLAYFLRFWRITNKRTTSEWRARALWMLLFCLMTQIDPKTTSKQLLRHTVFLLFAPPSTISTNTLGSPVSAYIAIITARRQIGFVFRIW